MSSARVHPQASGRALAASAAGSSKSGRMQNLLKRQLTQREFALEQEHRRPTGTSMSTRFEETARRSAESQYRDVKPTP